MKTIIAGGRDIFDPSILEEAIVESGFRITSVVCGGATGVDTLGEEWANNKSLKVEYYYPDWKNHGKAAGMIRNRKMAENAEALIAIWNGSSKGTKNMIETALKLNLLVYVKRV